MPKIGNFVGFGAPPRGFWEQHHWGKCKYKSQVFNSLSDVMLV